MSVQQGGRYLISASTVKFDPIIFALIDGLNPAVSIMALYFKQALVLECSLTWFTTRSLISWLKPVHRAAIVAAWMTSGMSMVFRVNVCFEFPQNFVDAAKVIIYCFIRSLFLPLVVLLSLKVLLLCFVDNFKLCLDRCPLLFGTLQVLVVSRTTQ